MKGVFDRSEPEAAHFCAEAGKRTLYAFFDLAAPTEICPTNEPYFVNLDTAVKPGPCMTQEDLEADMVKTSG